MFPRHPAHESSKLHQFVSLMSELCSFFVFSALFTEFCICACAMLFKNAFHIDQNTIAIGPSHFWLSHVWTTISCSQVWLAVDF